MKRALFWAILIPAIVFVYWWAGDMSEFSFQELFEKTPTFFELLQRMWPPKWLWECSPDGGCGTNWNSLSRMVDPLLDTIRVAILGTFLGALLSLPLIMLSTTVVTRNKFIYYPVRFFMGIIRSIPDLLYAVLFVAALGIGPVAGIPALAIFSAGIIAKMTSESTDNIDKGPLEAIEATGSGKLPMIFFAVIPQILPLFLSYTLYVFEINVRIAAVLAYVGAGGIGLNLISALQWFDYPEVSTILIVLFIIVFFIDFVSGRFRESLVEGKDLSWLWKGSFATVLVVGIIAAAFTIEVNYERVMQGGEIFARTMSAMFNPDWSQFFVGVEKMSESISIALIGTTISMFLAFPFGFLCANNLGFPRWLTTIMRQIPNGIRTFPEIILAIFFIATYGPGAFPGVMAIAIHSVGMLSRLNYEIVETIDRGPIEALNSIGTGRAVSFRFAVLPQVIPEFIAMAIYRFEINIRAATTLGIVGAGGIGALVVGAVRLGRWDEVGMFLLIVIVFVNIIDFLSAWARRKIIEG